MSAHVGILAYDGWVNAPLMTWLVAGAPHISMLKVYSHVPDIVMARNRMVKEFLEHDRTLLVSIDNDIYMPTPLRSLALGADVTVCREPTLKRTEPEAHPDIGSIAFCAIKRPVLEALADDAPVFEHPDMTADGANWKNCECRLFIEKVRAYGFSVETFETPVVHLKEMPLALTHDGQLTRAW